MRLSNAFMKKRIQKTLHFHIGSGYRTNDLNTLDGICLALGASIKASASYFAEKLTPNPCL
jgi:hypothetical protein